MKNNMYLKVCKDLSETYIDVIKDKQEFIDYTLLHDFFLVSGMDVNSYNNEQFLKIIDEYLEEDETQYYPTKYYMIDITKEVYKRNVELSRNQILLLIEENIDHLRKLYNDYINE